MSFWRLTLSFEYVLSWSFARCFSQKFSKMFIHLVPVSHVTRLRVHTSLLHFSLLIDCIVSQ